MEMHINSFNINCLAPTQNPPFWAPIKKFMCLVFGENPEKGTHISSFGGISPSKTGSQTETAIFGHKKFSLLFFACPEFVSFHQISSISNQF